MSALESTFVHRWEAATRPDAPTLLLLHGTGGDENDLLPLGRAVAPGWALLSPRGKVLEQGMARFFRRRVDGTFDQDDLRQRTDDLADFIAAAAQHYGFDAARVFALGFSNGANIAASLFLRHPLVLAGAALLHPMLPFKPVELPDLSGRPSLVTAGRADTIIPPEQARELVGVLQAAGANVEEYWHDGGHQITPGELRVVQEWFKQKG